MSTKRSHILKKPAAESMEAWGGGGGGGGRGKGGLTPFNDKNKYLFGRTLPVSIIMLQ